MQFEGQPEYPGVKILSEIDTNLHNYSHKIVRMFLKHANLSGLSSPRILDFGAGGGSLTEIWQKMTGFKPDCVELDPNLRALLNSKNFNAVASISELNGKYDFIYSSNVLEHIPDDQTVLNQLSALLNPKGRICIYVPAFSILFSQFDHSIGHLRRYTRNQISKKIMAANLKILYSNYSDSIGFLAILVLKVLGFQFREGVPRLFLIKIYDKFLLPIANLLDSIGFKYFFGKNVFVAAERLQD